MKVSTDLDSKLNLSNSIVTIGSFDGVHQGHQKIIETIVSQAKKENGSSVIISFDPHPRLVLPARHDYDFKLLSVLDEKQKLLAKYGIDYLVLLPFNKSFSNWPAEKFVKDVLVKKVNTKKVIIGYNHRFGKNREGDITYLINEGNKYGFEVEEISKQLIDEISISSTKIRGLLMNGEIDKATKLLGHHYCFSGNIVHGEKIGKSIGFPTANIKPNNKHKLIPCEGVYAIEANIENEFYGGMLHIGTKPSLNASKYSIEAHIFDFDKDIYNQEITIKLIKFLRNNIKFESLEELKRQLNQDRIKSKKILNSLA